MEADLLQIVLAFGLGYSMAMIVWGFVVQRMQRQHAAEKAALFSALQDWAQYGDELRKEIDAKIEHEDPADWWK